VSLKRGDIIWLLAYLAMLAGLIWFLFNARGRTLSTYEGQAARTQWHVWQQEAVKQSEGGHAPVQRRAPSSNEPPALVLMRDRFGAIVAAALITGSFLFGFLMLTIRGAFRQSPGRRE
jgi:hypothetical protein